MAKTKSWGWQTPGTVSSWPDVRTGRERWRTGRALRISWSPDRFGNTTVGRGGQRGRMTTWYGFDVRTGATALEATGRRRGGKVPSIVVEGWIGASRRGDEEASVETIKSLQIGRDQGTRSRASSGKRRRACRRSPPCSTSVLICSRLPTAAWRLVTRGTGELIWQERVLPQEWRSVVAAGFRGRKNALSCRMKGKPIRGRRRTEFKVLTRKPVR